MIRVLQVFHGMDCGGAENMIMNLYRKIDREKVQFDFLVHTNKKCFFDDEIKKLGGRIFQVPYFNVKNYFIYKKTLENLFNEHPEISIVHGHLGSCAHIYLNVAKKFSCFTIAHSHNTIPTNKSVKNYMYRYFTLRTRKIADYFFACGKQAGLDRFGEEIVSSNKFMVLNNAIDTEKFLYNEAIRAERRKEFGIEDSFVIGNVGRFNYQKNHTFLIDIFYEFQKVVPNAKLMLVGDGDLRSSIENKIFSLGIKDKVILTGVRSNVNELLQAMDCFVFPSHYEGLPVTIVEAQAASLPCIISDSITKEVNILETIHYLPINSGTEIWVKELQNIKVGRNNTKDYIVMAGYDIENTVKWLAEFYTNKKVNG